MYWFMSDPHFGHAKVIEFSKRPFKNIDSMNETIIENMLACMSSGDTLFMLGDFGFKKDIVLEALKRLHRNGIKVVWIIGNHDNQILCTEMYSYCEEVTHNKVLHISGYKPIQLSHFPLVVWSQSAKNSWLLYGHIHCNTSDREYVESTLTGKALNVNVEMHNYTPWSLLEVEEYMNSRPDNVDYTLLQASKLKDKIST